MIYCTRCLYPDTKPDLTFDENGVCSACLAFEARKHIDWDLREKKFKNIVTATKAKIKDSNQPYHCVIPVSGGKDSHYQVLKALEYDLRPLAVTAITDDLSDIGTRNLFNISSLGVDHVFVACNARVRRIINKYTLENIGDISWAEHITIFSVPVREALLRKIPLIIWGENPQNEYGGPNEESQKEFEMRDVWLQEFGGLNGLRVQDLVMAGVASQNDLKQYYYPTFPRNYDTNGIFLGQFFPWDGEVNAQIASDHGFEMNEFPVECSGVQYENLDNYQTGIHDRFKYLKFGFGRATDVACNKIRRGIMTREEGIAHVNKYDGAISSYLGVGLSDILEKIGLTLEEYFEIEKRFTNYDIFEYGPDGKLTQLFIVG